MLGAARDLRVDPEPLELLEQVVAGLVDVALALLALLGDETLDLLVLARMQRREGEVLQLPLDRVDAEAVGDRRVDVQRLLGLLDLLLLGQRVDRAHVVQPIGQLDQDDPDVRGHRDHHLAVVLGLRLVARLEGDPGQLRDAVDEAGDLLAEVVLHLLQRGRRVLDGVVQQRGAQRLGVEPQARAHLGHAHGMVDEVLAGLAPLVRVVLAGEREGLADGVAVDLHRRLAGVLLDDREQVAEQPRIVLGEARLGNRRAVGARVLERAHRPALAGARFRGRPRARARALAPHARLARGLGLPRAVAGDRLAGGPLAVLARPPLGPAHAARALAPLSHRVPSSWRRS